MMGKTLIAYFSRKGENYVVGQIRHLEKGNTKIVAKKIQNLIGGDLYEIKPVIPYADDYDTCIQQAKQDLNENKRPLIATPLPNLEGYEMIYIGYPNYWGTMPMHVFTFLEEQNLKDKHIKPFCTHEGSGMGHSESDLIQICQDAYLEKGLAIIGSNVSTCDDLLRRWV